jgi:hypothetical protein
MTLTIRPGMRLNPGISVKVPMAPPTLTVSITGSGNGTVTSDPSGINGAGQATFALGTSVTLTASAAMGSSFVGWSGAASGTGTAVVTMSNNRSVTATFNLIPPPPKSLNFNGSSDRIQVGGTTTDWSLNNLFYTIEFWSKATSASGSSPLTVMCQAPNNNRIDIYYQNQLLYVNNGRALLAEPTPGVWTHVALVCTGGGGADLNVYYNGVNVYTGGGYYVNDVDNDLWIGSRGDNTFQYFNGKLANIRLSNTPLYSATFTPPLTLVTDANTKLALSGELVDLSASAHTITNMGASASTDFPT